MSDLGKALINIIIVQGQRDKGAKEVPTEQGRAPLPKKYEENPDVPINPMEDEYNSVGDMLDRYLMENIKIPIAGKKRKKKKKFALRAFEQALIKMQKR